MMGYASRPADLARGPELDELRTGDLARRTTDGLFEIVGRRSRIAKLFGLRVDLDHLEARLASCGIEALCVEDHGALALVSTGTSTEVVRRSVAELAGLPIGSVRVALVGELPRSERGKPDRSGVAAACGMSTPPRNDTVRSIVADVLGLEDAPVAETFVSLGGDSLSYVEMSLRLEEALGHLPTNWHVLTIGELEDLAELATGPARPARCRGALRWRQVETSVAIRAVSVVLIVSSHVGLFRVRGGAHLLAGGRRVQLRPLPRRPGASDHWCRHLADRRPDRRALRRLDRHVEPGRNRLPLVRRTAVEQLSGAARWTSAGATGSSRRWSGRSCSRRSCAPSPPFGEPRPGAHRSSRRSCSPSPRSPGSTW